MRPRFRSALADRTAYATADLSRWTHRVGVIGHARDRHPHLGTPSDLEHSPICRNRLGIPKVGQIMIDAGGW